VPKALIQHVSKFMVCILLWCHGVGRNTEIKAFLKIFPTFKEFNSFYVLLIVIKYISSVNALKLKLLSMYHILLTEYRLLKTTEIV
jgi:hypothetical protein